LTDIGPRVALLTGLYQLAAAAGLAGQEPLDNSSSGVGATASEGWVLEVEAAGVGLWDHWLQVGCMYCCTYGERIHEPYMHSAHMLSC
jgi:hypothetical protein